MPKCFSVTLVNSNSERVFSFLILRVLSFSTGLGGGGKGAKPREITGNRKVKREGEKKNRCDRKGKIIQHITPTD